MIAIPNKEKPKGCRWCPLNHDSICYVIQPYKTDETNGEQCRNDCPLIEIVTCGECKKHGKSSCPMMFTYSEITDDNNYCSYAERRAE